MDVSCDGGGFLVEDEDGNPQRQLNNDYFSPCDDIHLRSYVTSSNSSCFWGTNGLVENTGRKDLKFLTPDEMCRFRYNSSRIGSDKV